MELDFEATGTAGNENDMYEVTVTATDPFGTPAARDDREQRHHHGDHRSH